MNIEQKYRLNYNKLTCKLFAKLLNINIIQENIEDDTVLIFRKLDKSFKKSI